MSDSRRELIETWFQRVWTEQDREAIFEMFPSGTAEGLGAQIITSPEEFADFHGRLIKLVSDITVSIDKWIDDGEWVSMLCTFRGQANHKPASISMTGSLFARIDEATILEAYNHWDFQSLWEQLDLLPNGSFLHCLDGHSLKT